MTDFVSFGDAYPNAYNRGNVGDFCRHDHHCKPENKCVSSPFGGATCRPSTPMDLRMYARRTPEDRNCHIQLYNGTRVYVPENACGSMSRYHLSTPSLGTSQTSQCDGCQRFHHQQTGTSHCMRTTQGGKVIKCNPQCCDQTPELEHEYMIWGKSPSFYGYFR